MKLMLGGTPVKKMMVHNDTMDATMVASDLQAGVTAYANGRKVTGTGKAFSFATYGRFIANVGTPIPTSDINTIVMSSTDGAVKMINSIQNMRDLDYSVAKEVAKIMLDGVEYPLTILIANNRITFGCAKSVSIQAMIGKDEFI